MGRPRLLCPISSPHWRCMLSFQDHAATRDKRFLFYLLLAVARFLGVLVQGSGEPSAGLPKTVLVKKGKALLVFDTNLQGLQCWWGVRKKTKKTKTPSYLQQEHNSGDHIAAFPLPVSWRLWISASLADGE